MLLFRLCTQLGLDFAVGGRGLLERTFELLVGLLLDGLRVLEFLNQLHLDALHIQNLVFLLVAQRILMRHLVLVAALRHAHLAARLLILLHLGQALLLVDDLVLHLVLGLNLELVVPDLLLVLRPLDFGLLGLLRLRKVDGLLDLPLFFSALFLDHVVLVGVVTLHFQLLLHLSLFLHTGF